MRRPDILLSRLTFGAGAICTALFLATATFGAAMVIRDGPRGLLEVVLAELAMGAGAATTLRLSHANARRAVSAGYVILGVVGLAIAMVGAAYSFGYPVQHLAFKATGSCGRWTGCPFDSNGDPYVLTSDKVPFIIFPPLIALIAWRGWRIVRRG
jgi:hypothetical protein